MSFFGKLKSIFKNFAFAKNNEKLEEILIEADFGVKLATALAKEIGSKGDITEALKNKIDTIISPLIAEINVNSDKHPFVIVLEGVNGSGKTTTVAKLAYHFQQMGLSVDIVACDTFRVAATDQLAVWANKLNCRIFCGNTNPEKPREPASLAYEALSNSKSDILLIDTAGRLQNNTNLMNELAKIHRVLAKIDDSAPHETILVLDATTGQNMVEQVNEFQKIHPITGLILNKLDGNAKGGALVRVVNEFKLPIYGVGIGETEKDFEAFSVEKFLKDLMEK
ncbi:MAG: signal recognition particle-docking protein FtsY [Alphaproteobacteria bacterium]|nr:signal recognition particle-docking protein FtsY [Alphaproteobacteria bacterium]MBQ3944586.1 signal recognition particle-docking protein FtsY [Alphaproteobacteria bacterium]